MVKPQSIGKADRTENADIVVEPSLAALLNEILDWALANRGTGSEFVSCYTYEKSPIDGRQEYPAWVAKARKLIGESMPDTRLETIYPHSKHYRNSTGLYYISCRECWNLAPDWMLAKWREQIESYRKYHKEEYGNYEPTAYLHTNPSASWNLPK